MISTPDAFRKPATFLMTSSTAPGHYLRVLGLPMLVIPLFGDQSPAPRRP